VTLPPALPRLVRDGLQLYTQRTLPDGPRRGVVLLVHGYAEYSGWYDHVVAALVAAGYAVYTLDHRGHGRSEGPRALVRSIAALADDLFVYLTDIRAAHPDEPIFVYGHSMGALISVTLILRHPELNESLSGLIASGVPLTLDESASPVQLVMGRILSRLAPTFIAPGTPRLKNMLSHDDAHEDAVKRDPLRYQGGVQAGTGIALIDGGRWAREHLDRLRLPLLTYCGAEDRLVPTSGTDVLFDGAASADKTRVQYDGMRHECHNEIDKARVLREVIAWIDDRAARHIRQPISEIILPVRG
jgi:acylglycerol lipase